MECMACGFKEGERKFIRSLLTARYHVKNGQHYEPIVYICPDCGILKIDLGK